MIRLPLFALGFLGLLCAAPAFAQEAPQPCQRGATALRMGGMDMDEMKCVQWLSQQQLGQAAAIEMHLRAQILLGASDLAAMRKQLSDLAAYAKDCGDKPGCFAAVAPAQ